MKLKFYEFAGRIVGKCLYESALGSGRRLNVKARFTRSFLAQLLGLRVCYRVRHLHICLLIMLISWATCLESDHFESLVLCHLQVSMETWHSMSAFTIISRKGPHPMSIHSSKTPNFTSPNLTIGTSRKRSRPVSDRECFSALTF